MAEALPVDLLAKALPPGCLRAVGTALTSRQVFFYLDLDSLLSASLVCRGWSALSQENFIWRGLTRQRWGSAALSPNAKEAYALDAYSSRSPHGQLHSTRVG